MIVFNSWYYSFSPYVANYLTGHWVERTVMKGVLYPLIGIMSLSSVTFSAVSPYHEMAALLGGLVASSLIGAFYVGLPVGLVRARIRRLRGFRAEATLEWALAVVLLLGLAMLGVGEIFSSITLLMISSVTIVLSTLFLSAAFTSGWIARKLQTK